MEQSVENVKRQLRWAEGKEEEEKEIKIPRIEIRIGYSGSILFYITMDNASACYRCEGVQMMRYVLNQIELDFDYRVSFDWLCVLLGKFYLAAQELRA